MRETPRSRVNASSSTSISHHASVRSFHEADVALGSLRYNRERFALFIGGGLPRGKAEQPVSVTNLAVTLLIMKQGMRR